MKARPGALTYAGPTAKWHLLRTQLLGVASVASGCLGGALNLVLAATMFKELGKQWFGRMKAMPLPFQAWLLAAGAEAAASAALAAFLVVAGAATLRRPGSGARLHRRYAWAKLPLACAFATCAGAAARLRVTGDLDVIAAAAGLALIASAAYPVLLLRTFAPGRVAASDEAGGKTRG
jgi:hypothetical protein